MPPRSVDDLMTWLLDRGIGASGTDCLRRLGPYLSRMNVALEVGTAEAKRWLDRRGGEAVTEPFEDGPVILFRDTEPSRSAVLEELAHLSQHLGERFVQLDAREMACRREIEAKACLLAHRERLGINETEDYLTRAQLEEERAILRELEDRFR